MADLRIYVACLASYNNGKLHGAWIDLDGCPTKEDLMIEILGMLDASPEPHAEEWAIHDSEGFGDWRHGEHPDLSDLVALARLADEHGPIAVELMSHHCGDIGEVREALEEHYAGTGDSVESWCEQFLDDTGQLNGMPESLRLYFDYEKYARDLDLSGDIYTIECDGEVHVFWNH